MTGRLIARSPESGGADESEDSGEGFFARIMRALGRCARDNRSPVPSDGVVDLSNCQVDPVNFLGLGEQGNPGPVQSGRDESGHRQEG